MKLKDLIICKVCGNADLETNSSGHLYCHRCCDSTKCYSNHTIDCTNCVAVTNVVKKDTVVKPKKHVCKVHVDKNLTGSCLKSGVFYCSICCSDSVQCRDWNSCLDCPAYTNIVEVTDEIQE